MMINILKKTGLVLGVLLVVSSFVFAGGSSFSVESTDWAYELLIGESDQFLMSFEVEAYNESIEVIGLKGFKYRCSGDVVENMSVYYEGELVPDVEKEVLNESYDMRDLELVDPSSASIAFGELKNFEVRVDVKDGVDPQAVVCQIDGGSFQFEDLNAGKFYGVSRTVGYMHNDLNPILLRDPNTVFDQNVITIQWWGDDFLFDFLGGEQFLANYSIENISENEILIEDIFYVCEDKSSLGGVRIQSAYKSICLSPFIPSSSLNKAQN